MEREIVVRNSLVIRSVPIDSLHLAEVAIVRRPKKQIEKAKNFLAAFGPVMVVIAAPDGEILYGEEFWIALKTSGATDVDVMIVTDKTPEELLAIRLALHRIPRDAVWDADGLSTVLKHLASVDFDIDLAGFDAPQINTYLNIDHSSDEANASWDDIPSTAAGPVSCNGNVWVLGEHRIGCGKATDHDFVRSALLDRPASCCFIDPAFNLSQTAHLKARGLNTLGDWSSEPNQLAQDLYRDVSESFCVLKANSQSDALLFACADLNCLLEMTVAGRASEWSFRQLISWVKPTTQRSTSYQSQQEFILLFGQELNPHFIRRASRRSNVWKHQGRTLIDDAWASRMQAKPVSLIADVLRDACKSKQLVLDTFLGYGSTLLAAEQTGRICTGIEADPLRLDVAIRRWQSHTGRRAILSDTGQSFDDVADQRLLSPPGEI
jgi:hypothetical protein